MGAPGRRVRRGGPAASSGRVGARGVRRRREPRRRRSPTSVRPAPAALRAPSFSAPRGRRQAAHGGAPWRSHAFTARPRRSSPRVAIRPGSRIEIHRASRSAPTSAWRLTAHRSPSRLPRRSSSRAAALSRRSPSRTEAPPRRSPSRPDAPHRSRADARRAHGSAGASRPTRRPGGLVGARRRAGRPPTPGAAPTSIADVGSPCPRRAPRAFVQRATSCRQAAHGGAPWRSHAFTARPRRSSPHPEVRLDVRAVVRRVPSRRSAPAPTHRSAPAPTRR
jgi:hypothetical protein